MTIKLGYKNIVVEGDSKLVFDPAKKLSQGANGTRSTIVGEQLDWCKR